ncbi:MAG: hypothetical protein NWE93_14630 [Candidatus Bathyarchaeota archaeon]|nr:hypothetical protein [Candidatus Bathyarchaeota archaeon]
MNAKPQTIKQREHQRIFDSIDDELELITANTKYHYTTCKINQTTLNLTLSYIEDTKKILNLLKARINILQETAI